MESGGVRVVRGSGSDDRQIADAQAVDAPSPEPFSPQAFAALRAHPEFRSAVTALARENLANYAGFTLAERWLISDLGRASLSGAVMILDAFFGGFPGVRLIQSALANRTCSEGRVRHYLRRAVANGFLMQDDDGTLQPSPAMRAVMGRGTEAMMRAIARLDPGLEPAPGLTGDAGFQKRLSIQVGMHIAARPDLFAGPDRPILLFLGRDGGTRMLEQVIAAQPDDCTRLAQAIQVSQRALAKGAYVSRTHVMRLLADGEAQGHFRAEPGGLSVAPDLCDDVERHYALVLEMARVSAHAALAGGT